MPGKKSVLKRMDEKIYHILPEGLRIARARTKFGALLNKARGHGMVNHGCVVIGRVATTTAVVEENTLIVDVQNGDQQSLDGVRNLGQRQISTVERVRSAREQPYGAIGIAEFNSLFISLALDALHKNSSLKEVKRR